MAQIDQHVLFTGPLDDPDMAIAGREIDSGATVSDGAIQMVFAAFAV